MAFSINTTSVAYRIGYAYQFESYLANTAVASAWNTYNASSYALSDLNTLRTNIISYQDNLTGSTDSVITLYNSANRFLSTVQLEYVYQLAGNTAQTGITLLNVYTSPETDHTIFGAIQTAIGTAALTSYNLLGTAYTASTSLATQMNNFISAVQTALGTTKFSPTTPVTTKSCVINPLNKKAYVTDKTIYTTTADVSGTLKNVFKAAQWVKSASNLKTDLILSLTGQDANCTYYNDKGTALNDLIGALGATDS